MADRVAIITAAIGPKKKVLVAESYGGSDEPVDTLNSAIRCRKAFRELRECPCCGGWSVVHVSRQTVQSFRLTHRWAQKMPAALDAHPEMTG
eukprot:9398074-Pyramimonas_sp.AAC.3